MSDKFTAVWVSHSSMSDFLTCPRAYYLKNVYKDPNTGRKIRLMNPFLALGQAVHIVLEGLSTLPREVRFKTSLIEKYETVWKKFNGKKGGFFDEKTEDLYFERGRKMLEYVMKNPGALTGPAVKISQDLPHYWLSEEDNIILCGKIDWLEYLPDTDSVHIIDFKTSKNDENEKSLQLPIYHLLVHNCQKRSVEKASYWYLERQNDLLEKELPDINLAHTEVLTVAKKVKLARQLNIFKCPHKTGCFACRPFEAILEGKAEYVGSDEYRNDVYIMPEQKIEEKESEIF
jgi:CRISPR/Cas system-associated exonuclease Cas4 (RecB family)